ncbi:MAG: TetR/AcrR family transcriptional regulator [Flavobacteriaceae bacterium]
MIKKHAILKSALTLFAQQGIAGTSTRQIAEHAKVSEGLIFRHFRHKKGLVAAIVNFGKEKNEALLEEIRAIESPKKALKTTIMNLQRLRQEDGPFWRLVFQMKFQSQKEVISFSDSFLESTTKAFKDLKFAQAKIEATLLLNSLEGLFYKALTIDDFALTPLLELMVKKYQLNE